MPKITWIKITTDMFDDEKIKLLERMPDADTLLIIWIKLICQAGKVNDHGSIYLTQDIPYNAKELATIFNREESTVMLALATFIKLRMIETSENGVIYLLNWEKHQSTEALDKIRDDTRKRVSKFRQQQRLLTTGNVTVTLRNDADVEEEEDYKKEKEEKDFTELTKKIKEKRFDEVLIGTESLASIIRSLKGERECLPTNLKMYRAQLKSLGIAMADIGIDGDGDTENTTGTLRSRKKEGGDAD